ncbi:methyl-accepting chemotaxis protein [Streptomyces sp. N2-109]|uniref:Methyl-accepting chemotaxis protein n=1 Tax=Streptomyces gossypii TaxID=2883101 RepID=A0ABT2JNG0_9ACTN|nr:methyl-accepting chemotaxis protein [Streptomyces gossypii]MCT2589415.1 methyl-accepting chemotaxis protein [Streptomyces gossypii]
MLARALTARQQVGEELAELAQDPGLKSRQDELDTLAKALSDGTDTEALAPWTELDLVQAYARPESVRSATRTPAEQPFWRWLEAGLGALVFVPLLLTWLGLTRASNAYESLIEKDAKHAGRPFLQLWQTGFEGELSGWFTFGHVAGSATTAIVLLLGCAALHGMRRVAVDRAEETARASGEDLLAKLVPVLVRAQLQLNEQRLTSPSRFSGELAKAADTLTSLTDKAVKVQVSLEKTAKQVGDSVTVAEKRLRRADAAVRPLADAADRIDTAVRHHGNALDKTLDQVRAAVEGAVRDNGSSVTEALGEIHTVNGEIGTQLHEAGVRVEDALSALNASQRSFTTSTEVAADLTGRTLTRLSEVAEQTAAAVTASQETSRQLNEQTDALRTAAERFAELELAVRLRLRLEERTRAEEWIRAEERAGARAQQRDGSARTDVHGGGRHPEGQDHPADVFDGRPGSVAEPR